MAAVKGLLGTIAAAAGMLAGRNINGLVVLTVFTLIGSLIVIESGVLGAIF